MAKIHYVNEVLRIFSFKQINNGVKFYFPTYSIALGASRKRVVDLHLMFNIHFQTFTFIAFFCFKMFLYYVTVARTIHSTYTHRFML